MSQKVEVEVGLRDRFSKDYESAAQRIERAVTLLEKQVRKTNDAGAKAATTGKQGADKATDAINKTGNATDALGRKLRQTGNEGSESFGKLQKAAAGFFTLAAAKEFGQKVFAVRSEIQSLQTSFETLVGNKPQAEELFNSIREFAVKTPMQMKGLASAAQTMMSFNIPVEQIMENLKALGDVSMGDEQKFQSLSLAFSQMSATGKLMGQDLLQMINAGFNPLATISEKTGKSIGQLKEEMEKGAISADMVRQAFIDATSEGGKFYGMLEAQSKTLRGAYSNLQGAIDDMFNSIGEQSEGIMAGAIDAATFLVQNYEKVGKAILFVVATYGEYKAAVMVNIALEKAQAFNRLASTKGMTAMQLATDILTKKTAALNAVLMANPYVLLAAAVMSAATAYVLFRNKTDEVSEAQKRLNDIKDEAAEKVEEEKDKIEELQKVAKSEQFTLKARQDAINQLNSIIPNYNAQLDSTTGKYIENKKALDDYLVSLARKYELEGAKDQLRQIGKEIAQTRIEITKATKSVEDTKKLQSNVGKLTAYNQAESQFVVANTARAEKDLDNANKKLSIKLKERQLIYDTFGEEMRNEVAGVTGNQPEDKKVGGKGGTTKTDKEDTTAKQIQLDRELEEMRGQARIEAANAAREAYIASIEDNTKREIEQERFEHEKRKQEIQLQAEEMRKARYEANKKQWELNNKGSYELTQEGQAGWGNLALSEDEQSIITSLLEKENFEYERILRERQEMLDQSMNDYLKDYGTYEEKKLAITKEYEKKITNAEEAGDKGAAMSLQKQMDEALRNLDFEQLKKDIDWEYVFGDLENIPLDVLDDVNEKLRKFKDTAKELKPDEIKAVVEAMSKIEARLGSTGSLSAARSATQARKSAQSEYDTALAFAQSAKGDPAKEALAYQVLIDKTKKLTQAKKKEDDAWGATAETASNYAKALREIGEFIGGTIGDVLNLGASAIEAGAGMANGIQVFKNSMDSLQRSVAILAIIQAALQAVRIISDLLGDSEDQTLKAYVESMDRYIDLLKDDINDLNKAMGDTKNTMTETIDLYKEYVDLQKESASAIRSQSQAWLNSGASKGFLGIGSKSSEGVKIVKGIEDNMKSGNADVKAYFTEAYNTLMEYAKKAGRDSLGRLDWIWNLSDEELRQLASNTKVMSALGNELGDSIRNYLEAINEVNDSEGLLFENLLSVDFDSFYEEFSDMISDMDNDSKNFADNFGESLRQSLIKNMVADQYRSTLKEFYDQIGEMSKAGTLEDNIDWAKQRYKAIADEARKQVEDINKITGYNNEGDEDKSFLDTIRNSFQNLLSGTVDDIEAWSKDIRKAIATSVMEGLLLDKEYDDWAKEWGNKYSDLMNRYFSGAVDEDAYKQELDVLVKDFNDKTKVIEERGKEMMKGFAESLAEDDTFKNMTDSWASSLMDFNKTAKDWAEDIGRTMAQKVIDQFVKASMMQPLLNNLQDAFNAAMKAENATLDTILADQGIASALQEITKAYPDLQAIAEKVLNAFGVVKKEAEDTKEEVKYTLSNLNDTLTSSLMDSEMTAEKFGKNIGRTLVEQMISQMIGTKFKSRIELIQKIWQGVLEGTNEYSMNTVKKSIVRLYNDIGKETKDLTDSIKEIMEDSDPFEGWRSNFLSFLMDTEMDIEDFMGDINEKLSSQLIDKFVLDGLDEQMAEWSKQMKTIMGSGGSPEQIAKQSKELKEQIAAYSEGRKAEAQLWHELMGTDNTDYGDQQASVNMADKATYDQFELFLGMQTAMMIGQEQGNAVRVEILNTLQAMAGITSPNNDYGSQIMMRLGTTNEYLLDIRKSNKDILESFGVKLDSINMKLSRL